MLNPLTHGADAAGSSTGLCIPDPPHPHSTTWYITAQSRTKDFLIFNSSCSSNLIVVAPLRISFFSSLSPFRHHERLHKASATSANEKRSDAVPFWGRFKKGNLPTLGIAEGYCGISFGADWLKFLYGGAGEWSGVGIPRKARYDTVKTTTVRIVTGTSTLEPL